MEQNRSLQKQDTGLVLSSKKVFLETYNPVSLLTQKPVNSFAQVFESKSPILHKISEVYGRTFTAAYLKIWITNVSEFLNVGKNMNDTQVDMTASMILDDYYTLKIEDVQFVFTKAMKGHYGKQYDRLDGQVILQWFEEYFNQRCDEGANASYKEHQETKAESDYPTIEAVHRAYKMRMEGIDPHVQPKKKDEDFDYKSFKRHYEAGIIESTTGKPTEEQKKLIDEFRKIYPESNKIPTK